MSFDTLQSALLAEAKTEVQEILERGRQQKQAEEQRITEQARQIEEQLTTQATVTAQQEARRLHQSAQLAAKAAVLTAKQEELERIEATFRAQVLDWDEEQLSALFTALLDQLPTNAGGTITPGSQHAELVQKLARDHDIPVSDSTLEGEGGFVFTSDTTEVDLTVSHLVRQLFTRHRVELAQTLFGS